MDPLSSSCRLNVDAKVSGCHVSAVLSNCCQTLRPCPVSPPSSLAQYEDYLSPNGPIGYHSPAVVHILNL